jgi:CTP:molybdopterin cytidylyltransferase MocA
VLAAGASRRYGEKKLAKEWKGQSLVRRAALAFIDAGLDPVLVVLPPDDQLRELVLGLPVEVVINPRPLNGIASSIAIGLRHLPRDSDGVLIGVADQPRLDAAALVELVQAFQPGAIVVPRYGDLRGNPRIFDRAFYDELSNLAGDRGGQQVAERHQEAIVEVSLPEELAVDIDRPEDWKRLED